MIYLPSRGVHLPSYNRKYDLSELWRQLDLPRCKRAYYWRTDIAKTLRKRKFVAVLPIKQRNYVLSRRNRTTYASLEGVLEYLNWISYDLYVEAIKNMR